jgi:hypothetical protein
MSLYHRPKGNQDAMHQHGMDGLRDPFHDDDRHTRIPSVIIVPQRPCRVTSTMAQHYKDMPGAGAEISPSTRGLTEGSSKSKPWQVDLAKKSYTNKRRFKRTSRLHSTPLPPPPPAPISPPVNIIICDGSPDVDGSWNNRNEFSADSGYPSDEEVGFGGFSSRGSSPAGSTQSGGSVFGGIVLKGFYGGHFNRSCRV